ncbi:MAG: tyrosine-type recombinase/integrase, partial [Syntrophobacteraceae bacterium]|nr:tyrosine-type recombinase/integrase [Syntrophobacteraceae bacterium]
MAEWHSTQFPGVRYREHPERKHGTRRDQYFAIRYQKDGERREEGLGWLSEGWTAQKAYDKLADLKRTGKTLQEEREETRAARRHAKAEEERTRLEAITFSEFWHKTYFPQVHHDKKPKTAQSEEQFFRLWLAPVLGDKTFLGIAPFDLEQIKRNMTTAGRSARTIQYALAVVRQVFNLARIRRVFRGPNPVQDVKKPSVDNKRMRFLTHEEADLLMAELKRRSLQLHDISLLSLHCGLRAGEIFNLEWPDVDFTRGQLFVK